MILHSFFLKPFLSRKYFNSCVMILCLIVKKYECNFLYAPVIFYPLFVNFSTKVINEKKFFYDHSFNLQIFLLSNSYNTDFLFNDSLARSFYIKNFLKDVICDLEFIKLFCKTDCLFFQMDQFQRHLSSFLYGRDR